MDLKGKVALVTGASRGIGAATAKLLAQKGAAVAINYFRSQEPANKLVEEIVKDGGKAVAIQANVQDSERVKILVEKTVEAFGDIDILVLNAGPEVPWKPFTELTQEEFETKLVGEMRSFFLPAKAIVPAMVKRGSGSIVGVSSGLSRYPGHGFSAHTTAKSAVDGLMKSLAYELGPFGIRVNTVAPGLTLTDATAWISEEQMLAVAKKTPMRRIARPEDVAGAIVLLVSDEAGFISGSYVPVSGGAQMP